MKKRLAVAVLAALAVSATIAVGSASAATEFGSNCTATEFKEGAIWVSTGHAPTDPLPVTAPFSGVITEWTVHTNLEVKSEGNLAGEFPRILQQRLLVLKNTGLDTFEVVGEATGGLLNLKGTNTYATRIPVQAGDYLGLAGNPYALFCRTGDEADTFGGAVGGTPVGSSFKVEAAKGLQVPVTARIEPDVDGDGYGDETQDKCPQSAAYQGPCPVVVVSSLSLAGTKAVSAYVTSSLAVPVTVRGTVRLGKGKKLRISTPARTVTPGTLARFRLSFPKPLREALKELSTKRTLTLSIAASAGNLAASPSVAKSTLKLRGQARPTTKR
ncbi:MAG: hypothetical protein JSU06_09565 [Actinobacteria bacterium]|nr:hypothetical protein [Actinomycetota bacterium]